MKKLTLLWVACLLTLQLYAGPKIPKLSSAARRIRSGRLLKSPSIPDRSARSNLMLERRLARIATVKKPAPLDRALLKHPSPTTFQVQYTDGIYQGRASAFAIRLRGKTWGVVADHVRRKIALKPYIRIKSDPHTIHIAPIERFYKGNSEAMDVALFEIPKEVESFVHPLEPAERPATAGEEVNISGFTGGQEVYLPQEKVLFATPMRLFMQNTTQRDLNGLCGSPILDQSGKVQAIYVGFLYKSKLYQHDWFLDLPYEIKIEVPDLHYAVPVKMLDFLAKGVEEHSVKKTGQPLKAFGKPIALLHPDESIYLVQQYRNGEKIAQLEGNPLMDPEQLELTFEWKENDVLRVIVQQPQTDITVKPHIGYDLNVSTGTVTEIAEKEMDLFKLR